MEVTSPPLTARSGHRRRKATADPAVAAEVLRRRSGGQGKQRTTQRLVEEAPTCDPQIGLLVCSSVSCHRLDIWFAGVKCHPGPAMYLNKASRGSFHFYSFQGSGKKDPVVEKTMAEKNGEPTLEQSSFHPQRFPTNRKQRDPVLQDLQFLGGQSWGS